MPNKGNDRQHDQRDNQVFHRLRIRRPASLTPAAISGASHDIYVGRRAPSVTRFFCAGEKLSLTIAQLLWNNDLAGSSFG